MTLIAPGFFSGSPPNVVVPIFEKLFGRLIVGSNERVPGFWLMVQGLVVRVLSYLLNPAYFSHTKHILPSDQEEYLFLRVQDALGCPFWNMAGRLP